MLEDLFVFPIVMVDGDAEEKKGSLGIGEDEVDIIIGEAECPYNDFISVADRWLPTEESHSRALDGKFDACYVIFDGCGGYVCPWTKTKFKSKLRSFIQSRPQPRTLTMTKEEFKELIMKGNDNADKGDKGHTEAE